MRFRFDANQEFQIEAIEAVTDLFRGQGCVAAKVKIEVGDGGSFLASMANRLDLGEAALLENLYEVQKRNGIRPDAALETLEENIETAAGETACRFYNFSVEMETGTGKTYVYLRTLLELNRRYGMRKFIIVVPSVAVREAVLKTLKVTEDHFKALFENPVYSYTVYDSANLTQVRQFALSDAVEVMVMTIQSFNKAANIIRQTTDRLQGETPIHLVQAAQPILILDEPQNMESDLSKASLALLNPLFTLRYSATHRNPYNVVYRLTPAEAYRQGLVKKIEVDSVIQEHDANRPFIRLEEINAEKRTISATMSVQKLMKTGQVQETKIKVRPEDSLAEKTSRPEYEGFEIDEIDARLGFVRFANNTQLRLGEDTGVNKEDIFRAQIRQTIDQHFQKQARLRDKGVKVLSLFFIDRVGNYVGDDDEPGIIRRLFDEEFNAQKAKHPDWRQLEPAQVQAAYFAEKRRKGGQVELLDSKSGDSADDAAAYDLIMRKKEELLAFPAPDDGDLTRRDRQVAFIFSHSALREGWDNPNIFQICTLNQTASAMRKRQEVGRGVRLAVDQSGNRVLDESVNILTVVANESYRRYVETYQDEIAFEYRAEIETRYGKSIADLSDKERRQIEEEYGEGILPPKPREAGKRKAKLNKARVLREDFKELWERIKHKTRYAVRIDTEKLLADVMPELDRAQVQKPVVAITRASVDVTDGGMFEAMQMSAAKTVADLSGRYPLPNLVEVMENLMEHTSPPVRVTRKTLLEVFRRLRNKQAVVDNPHEWASTATRILKEKLANHLVDGIQYEKSGEWYDLSQILDEKEIELFSRYVGEPDGANDKAIYDLIPCDSEVEKRFVRELEAREDVKLYVKLPQWFTVPTPVGEYNPDWAIVVEDGDAQGKPLLYLVSETKGSTKPEDLRLDEWRKIQCGAAHFGSKQFAKKGALDGVDYRLVSSSANI